MKWTSRRHHPATPHRAETKNMTNETAYTATAPRPCTPDPAAIELARRTREDEELNTLILFGSRARGDHREDSNVDLLIPMPWLPNMDRQEILTQRAKSRATAIYGENPPEIQLVFIHTGTCRRTMHAVNTIAAQAAQQGVVFSNHPSEWTYQGPDRKQELTFARANAAATLRNLNFLGQTRWDDQYDLIEHWYHAHCAVKYAATAVLSAAGERVNPKANIPELIETLNQHSSHWPPMPNIPWEHYQDKGEYRNEDGIQRRDHYRFTKLVRKDVDDILITNQDLHRWTKKVLTRRERTRHKRFITTASSTKQNEAIT